MYYPVAAVGGIVPVAVVSASFAAWAFASAAGSRWGLQTRSPALAFAATAPLIVMVSGMYPFLAGLAVAAIAIVLLQHQRNVAAAIAIVGVAAFSPLAFLLFLVVLVAAVLASDSPRATLARHRWPVLAVGGAIVAAAMLRGLFAETGYYPFSLLDLASTLGFSGAGLFLTRARIRHDFFGALFACYLFVNVALFAIPSPVGANGMRLWAVAALPLLWLAARLRTPALRRRDVVGLLMVAFVIQAAPYAAIAYRSYDERASAQLAFWRPAISFVRSHADAGHRVEVVATAGHWEAYYLAHAGVPLARGWYRQADFPENTLLYQSSISPAAYQAWLRSLGVTFVLLPDTQLDYSSGAEAALLRSGRSGLELAGTLPHWRFYRLPQSVGIVSGASSAPEAVRVTSAGVSFVAPRPGRYLIRVRYSPYWRSSRAACLSPSSDGMMRLDVRTSGPISLTMPDTLDAIFGGTPAATACGS
jgi:hypothetical protein